MDNNTHDQNPSPSIKIWKTSIPKAELALLPAAVYGGPIVVIETEGAAIEAAEELKSCSILGFDTETKPSFRRGERHTVALLQLSTPDKCYLFRLNKIGLPDAVRDVLEDCNILKIGVSIHDDFHVLKKKFKVQPTNFIDLQTYVKDFGIDDNSLSRINAILFGERISKGQRLSNWEAPKLSVHQMEYAALDAVACVRIYTYLHDHGFDHLLSPYYREYEVATPAVRQ